jgi:hypothetical protein
MKYLPQIIYILLFFVSLVVIGFRHGKEKKGEYNMIEDLIALAIQVGLMFWGGFFSVFFK